MSGEGFATFGMAMLVASVGVVSGVPGVLWLMALGLVAVLFANTYLLYLNNSLYKWQYGLFRFIAYTGMAIISFSTGGIAAVIPTLSSFLGMELQRLMTQLDLQLNAMKEKFASFSSLFKRG